MDRCLNCPMTFTPIEGDGPLPSPILALGERPGQRENQYGRVFCGPTGEEADYTYFPLARLQRGVDFRIENVCRCWALGNRAPTDKEVASCAAHFLPRVLEECQPSLLILMGASSHRIVDRKDGERKLRVDMMHGRPFYGSVLGGIWEGWIWSSYHPAIGMHDTPKMGDLIDDFVHLGEWRRGEWKPPVPKKGVRKDYGLIDTISELVAFIKDGQDYQTARFARRNGFHIYTDTERHGPEPWSIQFSLRPHSARMLRFIRGAQGDRRSADLFEELARWIHGTRAEVVLHNADQDLDAMERMCKGLGYPAQFSDTMVDAYNLCTVPQALKTAAYRLLGVTMRSWEDVVWPASVDAWMSWAVEAIDLVETKLTDIETTYMKTWSCDCCGHRAHQGKVCKSKAGDWKGVKGGCPCVDGDRFSNEKHERQPAALEKVLRHVLRHTAKDEDDDEPYNPWKAMPKMLVEGLRGEVPEKWEWEWVVEQLGPAPILGIANADLAEAVDYGCLAGEVLIKTADGTNRQLRHLVKSKYRGKVWSFDQETRKAITQKVIGWHRVDYAKPVKWMSVTTDLARGGRWPSSQPRYTPDHRLLTTIGWKEIQQIRVGDFILHPIPALDSVQLQVTLGSILGDGSLQKRNKGGWSSLKITHCARQLPYLRWKAKLLKELAAPIAPIRDNVSWIGPKRVVSIGHNSLCTVTHPELDRLRLWSYPKPRVKRVSTYWINDVSDLGLAIWYQDDGCLVDGKTARLYTNGFPKEDVELLERFLSARGFTPSLVQDKRGDERWFLCLGYHEAHGFFKRIAPFVHPCMNYKLPPVFRHRFMSTPARETRGLVQTKVTKVGPNPFVQKRKGSQQTAYCIDVEGTHCFATLNAIAHNCSDADHTGQLATVLAERRGDGMWQVDSEDYDK